MKTIKNSKDITTLEVGDKVIFGNLEYSVAQTYGYYLGLQNRNEDEFNDKIFELLNISKRNFVKNLGIDVLPASGLFPEVKSLEALTAIVSALFKEYEKQNELPKTWEEFCEKYPVKKEEAFIHSTSEVIDLCDYDIARKFRLCNSDKNICTSKQEAEAFLALMQLRQLRKAYVKNWEPNWTCNSTKFCIIVDADRIRVTDHYFCQRNLSFPTLNLAEQFLTNFKDLLEIAKPLL